MTRIATDARVPRRILLASSLTNRGDRALERAVALSRGWGAELHLVHAVEAPPQSIPLGVHPGKYLQRFPDPRDEALRLIERDIRPRELGITVHIEQTATPAAILEVAVREKCDLVVLGASQNGLIGPLGESTVEQVVRKSPASVLVVRDRVHGPYRNLLVGTDFTEEARQALVAVANLLPEAGITLMHSHSMAYSYLLADTPEGGDWAARQLEKLAEHVESANLPPEQQSRISNTANMGPPAAMLRRYALDKGPDLTVIGAYPRGILFDAVIGNTRRIIEAIPGDLLMVRAVRPAAPAA